MNYTLENYIAALREFNKIIYFIANPPKQEGTITKRGTTIIITPRYSDVSKITIRGLWDSTIKINSETLALGECDVITIKNAYQI